MLKKIRLRREARAELAAELMDEPGAEHAPLHELLASAAFNIRAYRNAVTRAQRELANTQAKLAQMSEAADDAVRMRAETVAAIADLVGVAQFDSLNNRLAELLRKERSLGYIHDILAGNMPKAADLDAEFRKRLGMAMGATSSTPEKLIDLAEASGRCRRKVNAAVRELLKDDPVAALAAIREVL